MNGIVWNSVTEAAEPLTVKGHRRRGSKGKSSSLLTISGGGRLVRCLQLAYDGDVAVCYVNEELVVVPEVEIFHVEPNWGEGHLPPAHREAETFCAG